MSRPERKRRVEILFWNDGLGRAVNLYIEPRDWWIGYYRSEHYNYVCPLPCVVIRWGRGAAHKAARKALRPPPPADVPNPGHPGPASRLTGVARYLAEGGRVP